MRPHWRAGNCALKFLSPATKRLMLPPRRRLALVHRRRSATMSVTFLTGSGSRRKITNVLFFDRADRTDWPAIDPRTPDSDKEAPVKASVARQPRLRANTRVEIHAFDFSSYIRLHEVWKMIWTLSDLKTMLSRDRDNDADWDASLRQILRRCRCVP